MSAERKPTQRAEKKGQLHQGVIMLSRETTPLIWKRISIAAEIISDDPEGEKRAAETIKERLVNLQIKGDSDIAIMSRYMVIADVFPVDLSEGVSRIRKFAAYEALMTGEDPRIQVAKATTPTAAQAAIRPVAQWSDNELIDAYGVDCNMDVVDELNRRSRGMAFVFFTDETGKTVSKEETLRFLRSARNHVSPPANYKSGKKVLRLYRAGEFPTAIQELCPIHRSISLFDSYCDQCKDEWTGVSIESRQFVAMIANAGYTFKKKSEFAALVELAKKGIEALAEEYPDVDDMFKRASETGNRPVLLVRSSSVAPGKADPVAPSKGGNRRF